jgi:regulator of nucleoside diphosphate kinase
MKPRNICITANDKTRLEELLGVAKQFSDKAKSDLAGLSQELARAEIVPSNEVPPEVVTMNSRVILQDLDTDEESEYTLVFPKDADVDAGAISVLAPIGTAILGYSKGDAVEWPVPDGIRRIRIKEILYQPESAGHFHL